ncbi:MAG TPA: hypothetical protein VHG32_20860 [Thermoanaerobaculia bacterium]|jgi:hypothetical protein|nr:hypothetical protein [Thermoanaerobaculia bacterium]
MNSIRVHADAAPLNGGNLACQLCHLGDGKSPDDDVGRKAFSIVAVGICHQVLTRTDSANLLVMLPAAAGVIDVDGDAGKSAQLLERVKEAL